MSAADDTSAGATSGVVSGDDTVDKPNTTKKGHGLEGGTGGFALCQSAVTAPLPCNYDADQQLQATTAVVNLAIETDLVSSGKFDALMPAAMNVLVAWVRGQVTTRVCIQALQLFARKSVRNSRPSIWPQYMSTFVEVLLAVARQAMIDGHDQDSGSVLSLALDYLECILTDGITGMWPALDDGRKSCVAAVMTAVVDKYLPNQHIASAHPRAHSSSSAHTGFITAATSILGVTLSHYTPSKCELFEVGGLVEVMARLLTHDKKLTGWRQIRTALLTSLAAHNADIVAAFACFNELDKFKTAYKVECMTACEATWLKSGKAAGKILADCKTELADCKTELADCKTELADCKTELANCKTELAEAECEIELAKVECKTKRADYKNELADCENQLAEAYCENKLAEAKCKTELANCKTELAECKTELAKCKTELAEAEAECKTELAEAEAECKTELAECKTELADYKNKLADCENILHRLAEHVYGKYVEST